MEKNIFIYNSVSQLWDGIMTAYTVTPLSPLLSFSGVSYLPRQFNGIFGQLLLFSPTLTDHQIGIVINFCEIVLVVVVFLFLFFFSVSTEMGSIAL